jgi:hypothetical protein
MAPKGRRIDLIGATPFASFALSFGCPIWHPVD